MESSPRVYRYLKSNHEDPMSRLTGWEERRDGGGKATLDTRLDDWERKSGNRCAKLASFRTKADHVRVDEDEHSLFT